MQHSRLEALFKKIHQFENLPLETLERIAKVALPRHFDAGQVIYIEGEPAEKVYLLEQGWVKATRISRDGREQAMMFFSSGEIFGDIAIFAEKEYPGTVVAHEEVDLWVIPASEFRALVEQDIVLAMAIIRRLSDRVLHYIGLVEDLSLRNVESRLVNTLLQHAETCDGQLVVPRRNWTTFDEMAIRLGTVRDVLSRAFKTLEADGLLEVKRHQIILLDPKELARRGNL